MPLVNGIHLLMFSSNPDADRAFFRDVLGFKYVDVGHGWLIFGLPPAEAAFHPKDEGAAGAKPAGHRMVDSAVYLMCDDLQATIAALAAKKIACAEIAKENWGITTTVRLPSGGELGLYQPMHETALALK